MIEKQIKKFVNKTWVKRKIDFKSFSEKGIKAIGQNNNAQVCRQSNQSNVKQGRSKSTAKSNSLEQAKDETKNFKSVHQLTKMVDNQLNDGIQVTTDYDEEDDDVELDYDDILMTGEEDEGSIDADIEQDRETQSVVNSNGTVIGLGATSTTLNEEELVMSNPHLKKLLNKMLDERLKQVESQGQSSNSRLLTSTTPNRRNTDQMRLENEEAVSPPTQNIRSSVTVPGYDDALR